jgi:putative iron-dependent peroxidase
LKNDYDERTVRKAVSQVPEITSKLMASADDGSTLVALVGLSNELWKCWDAMPPKELKDFTDIKSKDNSTVFPATGGDLFLLVKSNSRQDLCFELAFEFLTLLDKNVEKKTQTPGFRYKGGRDLTGFIDGTRNPDHLLRALVDVTIIFPDDDRVSHEAGSYMYAGRYVHDLPKFHKMPEDHKRYAGVH